MEKVLKSEHSSATILALKKKTSLEKCLFLGLEKRRTLNVVKASCARKQERPRKYKEEAWKGHGNKVRVLHDPNWNNSGNNIN